MNLVKELDVALGICERNGTYLFLQRRDKEPQWDKKWELPGGKIHTEERPEEALIRELREETGLRVIEASFFASLKHDWHLKKGVTRVYLHVFICRLEDGVVQREKAKTYQHVWVHAKQALELDVLEANHELLKRFFHENSSNLDRN